METIETIQTTDIQHPIRLSLPLSVMNADGNYRREKKCGFSNGFSSRKSERVETNQTKGSDQSACAVVVYGQQTIKQQEKDEKEEENQQT